ncbi:MAG: DegT/DnrJ/EryC1/StrS family aminotransferase [Verrucomicrobiales bacterium]
MEPILANDFKRQWDAIREPALAAADRVGCSGWLILGREVDAFERELADSWDLPHAIGFGNCLDATELALRALDLQPGEPVLTTPLSAFATTLAIVRAGGRPVFCDVDSRGLIDLDRAEACLAKDNAPRFFVPVHLYGFPLDMARLAAIRERSGTRIIEDCAQSIGAVQGGVKAGAAGHIAVTSFYPTKNLGAMGDGGAALTRDSELDAALRSLRDYGQTEKYVHALLGSNSRLDELHAAILRDALLPRLGGFTKHRRAVAAAYRARLANPLIEIPAEPEDAECACHLFPVLAPRERRDEFLAYLRDEKIGAAIHYPMVIPDQPALIDAPAGFEVLDALENARSIADREVSLPIHPFLRDAEVDRVVEVVNAWR